MNAEISLLVSKILISQLLSGSKVDQEAALWSVTFSNLALIDSKEMVVLVITRNPELSSHGMTIIIICPLTTPEELVTLSPIRVAM